MKTEQMWRPWIISNFVCFSENLLQIYSGKIIFTIVELLMARNNELDSTELPPKLQCLIHTSISKL
jgi:hypothetical protein